MPRPKGATKVIRVQLAISEKDKSDLLELKKMLRADSMTDTFRQAVRIARGVIRAREEPDDTRVIIVL